MAAKFIGGTPRSVSIDLVDYDVMADTNITEMVSPYENTSVPTSGRNLRKMTKRSTSREGLVLGTDADEKTNLVAISVSADNVQLSYTNAAGDTYRAKGWIEVENNETEESRTAVQMHPETDWALSVGEV